MLIDVLRRWPYWFNVTDRHNCNNTWVYLPWILISIVKQFWKLSFPRRVWRYQSSNQNPYIEEEQTTQCPKEKVQKDKQRSKKHTHNTKDRVTRTPLKIE